MINAIKTVLIAISLTFSGCIADGLDDDVRYSKSADKDSSYCQGWVFGTEKNEIGL